MKPANTPVHWFRVAHVHRCTVSRAAVCQSNDEELGRTFAGPDRPPRRRSSGPGWSATGVWRTAPRAGLRPPAGRSSIAGRPANRCEPVCDRRTGDRGCGEGEMRSPARAPAPVETPPRIAPAASAPPANRRKDKPSQGMPAKSQCKCPATLARSSRQGFIESSVRHGKATFPGGYDSPR